MCRDSNPPSLRLQRCAAEPRCLLGAAQVGDPLEIKLFESTGWKLLEGEQGSSQESHHSGHHIRVQPALKPSAGLDLLQRFDFSSECARCTVVVRGCTANAATRTFVKGSPEVVCRIVDPATIPVDFNTVLDSLTQEGFRYKHTPRLPNLPTCCNPCPSPCVSHLCVPCVEPSCVTPVSHLCEAHVCHTCVALVLAPRVSNLCVTHFKMETMC